MTTLEIYGLTAPVVLFALCAIGVWWQLHH